MRRTQDPPFETSLQPVQNSASCNAVQKKMLGVIESNLRGVDVVLGRDGWHTGRHGGLCRRVLLGTFLRRLLAREELYCRNRRVTDKRIVKQHRGARLFGVLSQGWMVVKAGSVEGAVKWWGVMVAGGEGLSCTERSSSAGFGMRRQVRRHTEGREKRKVKVPDEQGGDV